MQRQTKETKSQQTSLPLRGKQRAHQRSMQKHQFFLEAASLSSTNFPLQICLKPHTQLSTIIFTTSTKLTVQTPQTEHAEILFGCFQGHSIEYLFVLLIQSLS